MIDCLSVLNFHALPKVLSSSQQLHSFFILLTPRTTHRGKTPCFSSCPVTQAPLSPPQNLNKIDRLLPPSYFEVCSSYSHRKVCREREACHSEHCFYGHAALLILSPSPFINHISPETIQSQSAPSSVGENEGQNDGPFVCPLTDSFTDIFHPPVEEGTARRGRSPKKQSG